MPIYRSAPDGDEALEEAQRMVKEVTSVLKIQEIASAWIIRRQTWREEHAAEEARRALEYAASGAARGHERAEPDELSPDEDEPPAGAEEPVDLSDMPFVIRNLDTGEATSIATDAASDWSKLSLGSLQPGTSAWESTKAECRGLLEKLASKSTFSFRSYQLCVWQERYVFAEDDALCYQQLSQDRVPTEGVAQAPLCAYIA